jgi:hypothetical protein
MAYTNTLYHLTFDALPLTNPVGTAVVVSGTPTLTDGIHRNAMNMSGVRINSPHVTMTNKFGIGFWLKPVNQGLAENPITHESLPLRQAIAAQGSWNYSSGQFIGNNHQFVVYEETQDDGTNKLVACVNGLSSGMSNVTLSLKSSAYSCNEWHHFFINYSGGSFFDIYIDTVLDVNSISSGTMPVTLSTSTFDLTLNTAAPGFTYQVVQNTGEIDDFVIFNSYRSLDDIQRIANQGALYVADSAYANVNEIHQGFIVDDPSTVQITSVFANRGNIYVGRTDGKLLRGVRSLWESRHEFSDLRELDLLTVVKKTADNTLSVTNGVLQLKNEIIRI